MVKIIAFQPLGGFALFTEDVTPSDFAHIATRSSLVIVPLFFYHDIPPLSEGHFKVGK